jgi:hypothetical protein
MEEHMPYTTNFDSACGVFTVQITGEYTRPRDNASMQRLAVDSHRQHGCRLFLFDLREASVTGGTMALYESAAPKGDIADALRRFRTAVVSRKLGPDERFYETVALNRGFSLRMFDSIAEAMDWLTGKTERAEQDTPGATHQRA